MLNYIIRRILLMIPTLFGITIMVFLIARNAPGQPGAQAFGEGGNQMNAEGRKKLLEARERRFGLNLPMHLQYLRWWRGMFINNTEARAWTSDFKPVYTLRREVKEYYTRDPNGKWYLLQDWHPYRKDDPDRKTATPAEASFMQTESFLKNVPAIANKQAWIIQSDDRYPLPQDVFVDGAITPIEDLQPDLLAPATISAPIKVEAQVWTNVGGFPVYVDPGNPDRLIYPRRGDWYSVTPNKPEDRWDIYSQNDPSFKSKIPSRYFNSLPPVAKRRPIPRHAGMSGKMQRLEGKQFDESQLTRKTILAEASIDSMMWMQRDGALWPVLTAKEPEGILAEKVSLKLVKGDDGKWYRVIGKSRLADPDYTKYKESEFVKILPDEMKSELPTSNGDEPTRYFVVMKGKLVSFPGQESITERDVRRYSLPIDVFEITLGKSITSHTTVIAEMKNRLWITLRINIIAFLIIYLIAIPTGMLMAMKRGRFFDSAANITLLALWSVPSVLSATLFIGYLGQGGNGFEWFPTSGLFSNNYDKLDSIHKLFDQAWHLVLPITCMVYGGFAYLAKQMRASMLENFTMDYVRTAKAKGVSVTRIVLVHVLRNSLIPLITILATLLPAMIAGTVIIEKIFNIEGMGLFTFRAVTNRDFDVVQSMALIAGALNLTGLLIADICYAIVDPRIAYK